MPDPIEYPCGYCETWGVMYFHAETGEKLNREQYDALEEEYRGSETCPHCNGEGWLFETY
jgi:hypothetical protein